MSDEEQNVGSKASAERLGILKIIGVVGLLIVSFYVELIRAEYGIRIPFVNSILGGIVGWELFAKRSNRKWKKAVIMVLSIFFLSLFLQMLYPLVFLVAAYLIHNERKRAGFGRKEYWTLNVIIAAIILQIPLLFLIEYFSLLTLFLFLIIAVASWLFYWDYWDLST